MPDFDSSTPDDSDARDVVLMREIAGGSEAAMRELIERHELRVLGTIRRMLGSERDAEDLAQQVFIRIWKSAPRWEANAKFTTWLYTIVRNLVFNETRRRKHADLAGEIDPEWSDPGQSPPDASVLAAEKADAINAAIAALPEAQRMAVILRRYEDTPYEEIAAVLGQSVPAVKSLLFRARITLRESLRKYLE